MPFGDRTVQMPPTRVERADYGIDAPYVLPTQVLKGAPCLLLGLLLPPHALPWDSGLWVRPLLFLAGLWFILQGLLYVVYVKVGKYRHRDLILSLHCWRGHEQVLDVGCGRGLLAAGAAKVLAGLNGTGHVTGVDIWSNEDMAANSAAATRRNLQLEGIAGRCSLHTVAAQDMVFSDASFDVVVSNLCLHNIRDPETRRRAVRQIARVLKPGGVALLSDIKRTGEYAAQLRTAGFEVERRWTTLPTYPPMFVVVARKPPLAA